MGRGRFRLRSIAPAVLIVAGIGACGVVAATACGVPDVSGVWQDVDDSRYYIEFLDDNTYRDSTYGVVMPYEVTDDSVVFHCVDGSKSVSDLQYSLGKEVAVHVDGVDRVVKPVRDVPVLAQQTAEVSAVYKVMQGWDGAPNLRLYSDKRFELTGIDSGWTGTFVQSDDKVTLYKGDGSNETLKAWDRGYVAGRVETSLRYDAVKANVIDIKGFQLDGLVSIPEACVSYNFLPDNSVTRTSNTGEQVDFVYFVDPSGLITMSDLVGQNVKDYLWLDISTGDVYRYVFERDDWVDYVNGLGVSAE